MDKLSWESESKDNFQTNKQDQRQIKSLPIRKKDQQLPETDQKAFKMSIAPFSDDPLKASNFQVCVRIRPLNVKEENQTSKKFHSIVQIQDKMVFLYDPNESSVKDIVSHNQSSSFVPTSNPSAMTTNCGIGAQKRPEKEFIFDEVFSEQASTEEVFRRSILPSVDHIMNGYNSTIFAYGMTGAGKTYTIFGNLYGSGNSSEGIALMTLKALSQKAQESTNQITFKFSYLEIYNESIRDLMVPKSENLMVIEDSEKGVFVPDLTEYPLESPEEIKNFIIQGNTRRIMASTAANQFSSRSHAIIQIICEQKNHGQNQCLVSKLCIVDLAGSERAASTENRGIRLTEGANINRSLLSLGNCINLLADSNKKGSFVPYRDSKLTRLLKESLGGNTRSIMIACISSSSLCYEETMNTMKYASRARNIKKSVKKNAQEMSQHVSEYKSIIQGLRSEIISLKDQLQIKVQENLQLKNKQKLIHQYNSGGNTDFLTEDIKGVGNLDEIGQKLFENLEEQWEIKNTIEEIINLNQISECYIREQEEKLERNYLMSDEERRRSNLEIEKRREVIKSNQDILVEMNLKLAKNSEQKKELQINIKSIGSQFTTSIYQCEGAEETKDVESILKIQEMQKQMEFMQQQLLQKDKLLQQKQQIIKDLTGKETPSTTAQPLQKKSMISSMTSSTTSQPSTPLLQPQQSSQQNQMHSRKFYLKIPKEMISDRTMNNNHSSCSSSNVSINNQQILTNQVNNSLISGGVKNQLKRQTSINNNFSQVYEGQCNLSKKMREGYQTQNIQQQQQQNQANEIDQQQQAQPLFLRTPSSNKNNPSNCRQVCSQTQQTPQQQGVKERQISNSGKKSLVSASKNESNSKKVNNGNGIHKQQSINVNNSAHKMEISISELKQYAQKLKNVDFTHIAKQQQQQQNNFLSQIDLNENQTEQSSKIIVDKLENISDKDSKVKEPAVNIENILRVSQLNINSCLKQLPKVLKHLQSMEQKDNNQLEELCLSEGEMEDESDKIVKFIEEKPAGQKQKKRQIEQKKNANNLSHQQYDLHFQEQPKVKQDASNQDCKSKSSRSLSCYKIDRQDYELNSYALARKKMREFKDKLIKVSENSSKYSKEEIENIIKEYKTNNYQIKTQEDSQRLKILESLIAQSSTQKVQEEISNENQQPSSFASSALYKLENLNKINIAQSTNCIHTSKKSNNSQHNGIQNNQSYAQQQQLRMLKNKESNSNSNNNNSNSACTNTNPNALKNISNNLYQIQPSNPQAAQGVISKNKKVLPRGLLSQLNSNYAESVTYSKKAINQSTNSNTTTQSQFHHQQANHSTTNIQSRNNQRIKSPTSTKNRDTPKRNQENFGILIQNSFNQTSKEYSKYLNTQVISLPQNGQQQQSSSILHQYNSETQINNSQKN